MESAILKGQLSEIYITLQCMWYIHSHEKNSCTKYYKAKIIDQEKNCELPPNLTPLCSNKPFYLHLTVQPSIVLAYQSTHIILLTLLTLHCPDSHRSGISFYRHSTVPDIIVLFPIVPTSHCSNIPLIRRHFVYCLIVFGARIFFVWVDISHTL
jgi:hypothetical protein